jgi:hypothetical protein
MALAKYLISLSKDEEVIAGFLSRDAWVFFNNSASSRELALAKEIPLIPRRGTFSIAPDEELIQYYLDHAHVHDEELHLLGWEPLRIAQASAGFVRKLEDISGQVRGASRRSERMAG